MVVERLGVVTYRENLVNPGPAFRRPYRPRTSSSSFRIGHSLTLRLLHPRTSNETVVGRRDWERVMWPYPNI